MFFKIGLLKNFAKSHENRSEGLQLYLKETPIQVFSCEFCVVLRVAFKQTPPDDCFWRRQAEFFVAIYIGYPAAIIVKLKEHLEIQIKSNQIFISFTSFLWSYWFYTIFTC